MSPLPDTLVVSGFLGAGKTTLVGHLLAAAQRRGERLAILSNEFGDTGIDKALMDAGEDGIVELDGGCLCCRLSDAVPATVMGLLERAKPDRLVVETSGVAMPGEVAIQFWRPPLRALVAPPRIVIVVDAIAMAADQLDATWFEQVDSGEAFVLNHADGVPADTAEELRAALEARTGREVRTAVHADVDVDWVWGVPPRRPAAPSTSHGDRYGSTEHAFPAPVLRAVVEQALRSKPLLRAKGFVITEDGLQLVQGVGNRLTWTTPQRRPPEALIGRVVTIGPLA